MQNHILKLQNEYQRQLREASIDYLRAGLDLFHKYRRKASIDYSPPVVLSSEYNNPQAALGNLGISVELMLKAIIVGKHLLLLFKDFPADLLKLRVSLISPDDLPTDFEWRFVDIELRSVDSKIKTINFGECISIFCILFPNSRQLLESHLNFLSLFRNASVHSVLPNLNRSEVERAAYVAIHVHEVLTNTLDTSGLGFLSYTGYVLSDEDKEFIATFQGERLNRVKGKIDEAKKAAMKLAGQRVTRVADDWEHYVIRCCICDNDIVLEGYTEAREIWYGEDDYEMELGFFPSSY